MLRHIGWGNLAIGRLYKSHAGTLLLVQLFSTPTQATRWAADAAAELLFGYWSTEGPANGLQLKSLPNGSTACTGPKPLPRGPATRRGHSSRGPCPIARARRCWCCPPMCSRPYSTARFGRLWGCSPLPATEPTSTA